jgi:hypothetical protein
LGNNLVRSILVDKKGDTWVGGINGGLDLFHAGTGTFYHYQNEPIIFSAFRKEQFRTF